MLKSPLLTLCLVAVSTYAQAAVYLETFSNSTETTNFPFSSVAWNAYEGTTDHSNNAGSMLVSFVSGRDGATRGYGAKTSTSNVGLIWTSEFTSFALADITNISFYSNNSSNLDGLRIALRLDNNTPGITSDDFWVATNTAFIRNSGTSGTAANWNTNGELENFIFNTSASNWRDLTFVQGTSLQLAAGARSLDLPTGNVIAAGLYISLASNVNSSSTGVVRFDDFQITTVPEPGITALLTLVGLAMVSRRSRK